MSTNKIVIKLMQGQREHMKMVTGFGPARLNIELSEIVEPTFGKPWSSRMTSKAIKLNGEQKEQINEATGNIFDYILLKKDLVEKWMKG